MSRIVNQLLLVARLETLNVPLDEPVDLCLTARQAAENLGADCDFDAEVSRGRRADMPVLIRGNGLVVTIAISNLGRKRSQSYVQRESRSDSCDVQCIS